MRVELGLWWIVIVTGFVTYYACYAEAFDPLEQQSLIAPTA